jgi:hypothetical protein
METQIFRVCWLQNKAVMAKEHVIHCALLHAVLAFLDVLFIATLTTNFRILKLMPNHWPGILSKHFIWYFCSFHFFCFNRSAGLRNVR